jgi:hypothetical protein
VPKQAIMDLVKHLGEGRLIESGKILFIPSLETLWLMFAYIDKLKQSESSELG